MDSSSRECLFSSTIQFRDPLMHVVGLQNYRLNFAALHSAFRRTQLDILSVTTGTGLAWAGCYAPNQLSNIEQQQEAEIITIEAWATYEFNRFITFRLRQVGLLFSLQCQ